MSAYDPTEVDAHEAEKTEIQLPVIVYFHGDAEDTVEVRERIEAIRYVIQSALADDENDIRGFTYPEVRLEKPKASGPGGLPARTLDV